MATVKKGSIVKNKTKRNFPDRFGNGKLDLVSVTEAYSVSVVLVTKSVLTLSIVPSLLNSDIFVHCCLCGVFHEYW